MKIIDRVKSFWRLIESLIGKFFLIIFDSLFKMYGWRGFLFRIVFVLLFLKLGVVGRPEYNSAASGVKVMMMAGGLFIYAVGKLIYDYTRAGKGSETNKSE